MDLIFFVLMAFHVVGVLVNLRMLVHCLKEKARYSVLQSCRSGLIFQGILHVAVLALNAEESVRVFSAEETKNWCTTNNIFIVSLGFVMVYNLLAMLATDYHTILFLRRVLSPHVALLGTLTAGIATVSLLYWAGCFTIERLCSSQMATTVGCSLLLLVTMSIVWHIWSGPGEYVTKKMKSSEETSHDLLDLLIKSKTSTFVTCLFLFCVGFALLLELISSEASFSDIEQVEDFIFYKKVFYLYVLCFGVGISLPLIFHELIVSSVDEKVTANDPPGEKAFRV